MKKQGLFFYILILFFFSCHSKENRPVMKPRFTVLTLGVDNVERAYKFYHEGLGFPSKGIVGKEFEHGEAAFFDLPHGMILSLYARADLAWDAKVAKQDAASTVVSIGYMVKSESEW